MCDSTEDASQPQAALGDGSISDTARPSAAPRAITASWQAIGRHTAGALPRLLTSSVPRSAKVLGMRAQAGRDCAQTLSPISELWKSHTAAGQSTGHIRLCTVTMV